MEERHSFVLYSEYEEAFSALPPDEQGALVMAIFSYVRTGEIVNLPSGAAMAFRFIRGQLDRDWKKYDETREKRSEAGRKGGKQTQANKANACTGKQRPANQADNEDENGSVSDNGFDNEVGVGDGERRSGCPPGPVGWIPPTIGEVSRFCDEQGLMIDATRFVKHYHGRNWLLGGGGPMTDWKAAVLGWAKRESKLPGGAAGARNQSIPGAADYEAENNFL